ncbi:hypothetical protein [Pantoea coffeiphila]|uniref:Uncharacterized protein n=1 Tax=Pantoea coffeiphila TaxID=1465635 RepID=A0A2S9I6T5_9GAMM|nr:hypothetical protein [Pantoea coffeiphila]PRD13517.1 hypothetical protein CQW29_21085 [Pantoea coffeiphila]
MDKTIVIALIAAGSAFAGVVGGGISNYFVNTKMEREKLISVKKELLYEQLNIIYHQTVKAGEMNLGIIEVDHSDELLKENFKATNPLRKVDALIKIYFKFLIEDYKFLCKEINLQNSLTRKIEKNGLTKDIVSEMNRCRSNILNIIDRMHEKLVSE